MSLLRRFAIALIVSGLVVWIASAAWLATRKLDVLDVPVSLSPGHIRTQEFQINFNSSYLVAIAVERGPSFPNLDCQMWGCYNSPVILRALWTLSSGDRAVSTGDSDDMYGGHGQLVLEEADGRVLGGFESKAGRYRLDVDVLSGASSLNKGHPKLIIELDGNGYERLIRWQGASEILAGILGTIGIALAWLSRPNRDASRRASIRLFPGSRTGYGSAFHARRPPRAVLFSKLPSIALYLIFVSMLLLCSILFMLGLSAALWHGNGIQVLTSSRTLSPQLGQGARPLVLRIDSKERWFLDAKPVSPEQFPGALREALSRRADWAVCLEADPELDFGRVAKAMDAIQGLYAKIILVTPKLGQDRCTEEKSIPVGGKAEARTRP